MTASPAHQPPSDPDAAGRHARKEDHVRLARAQWTAPSASEFDDVEFVHHAVEGVNLDAVDLTCDLLGRTLTSPFYINGMTGGTESTGAINRTLAIAARETGLAMACGSMSIALEDATAARAFTVIREENPEGFVMANLGVGRSASDACRAVEILGADALQLHVNAVQETVMPESAPEFGTWLRSIEEIAAACPVPVLVKEVGFGLSPRTLRALAQVGVGWADVSGRGGTDFLRIENDRRRGGDYAYLTGFGQSAAASLLDAAAVDPDQRPALLASGGVRTPLDVLRCLALGARGVGVAGAFLTAAGRGEPDELVDLIRTWQTHTRELSALLGCRTVSDLAGTDLLIRGRLREFCELRGIDAGAWSRRR